MTTNVEMKVIQSGNSFTPITKDAVIHDDFPAGIYKIRYSQMSGYDITEEIPFEPEVNKIYGKTPEKIEKMMESFAHYEKNMGVMLSGPKGIGKSLFIRLSALKFIEEGKPVFIIDGPTPGLADYLSKIKQECLIFIDEFEKKFNEEHQNLLLGFLDGMNTDKKLIIVSLNELNRINSYMINRPGRFHYHYEFTNPSSEEVFEYLKDNLKEEYHDIINSIVSFSQKTSLNYDSLKAIIFEINLGRSLEESLQDLNISRTGSERFELSIKFSDGQEDTVVKNIDLFSNTTHIREYNKSKINGYTITFDNKDVVDSGDGKLKVKGNASIDQYDEDGDYTDEIKLTCEITLVKYIPTTSYSASSFYA